MVAARAAAHADYLCWRELVRSAAVLSASNAGAATCIQGLLLCPVLVFSVLSVCFCVPSAWAMQDVDAVMDTTHETDGSLQGRCVSDIGEGPGGAVH